MNTRADVHPVNKKDTDSLFDFICQLPVMSQIVFDFFLQKCAICISRASVPFRNRTNTLMRTHPKEVTGNHVKDYFSSAIVKVDGWWRSDAEETGELLIHTADELRPVLRLRCWWRGWYSCRLIVQSFSNWRRGRRGLSKPTVPNHR